MKWRTCTLYNYICKSFASETRSISVHIICHKEITSEKTVLFEKMPLDDEAKFDDFESSC